MSLEELQKKREELRKKIGEVKEIREKYNDKTKELKKQRYNLAIKIRKFKQEGIHHKEQRDKTNVRVAKAKERRKELNKEFKEHKRNADNLRNEIIPEATPLEVLKKRKQDLDFRQMTHQLSKKDEESLVEELKHITQQIRHHQQLLNETPELKEAMEKKVMIKEKGDKEHQKVKELADRAQEEHLKMIEAFNKSDELYRQLKEIQKQYVLARLDADKAHKKLVTFVKEIREVEDEMSSIKKEEKAEEIREKRTAIQQKADDVYERFKKGEKLSTEDFMLLQKAGLI